jgi:N,N'-diacetyllegionaminate synthase
MSGNNNFSDKMFNMGNNEPFIIAEIAQAHDGSLGTAHAYIDAVSETGVDAIKFQTHIAHSESTLDEQWRVNFSYQDDTRYDYWERMGFTQNQWKGLAQHAAEKGLEFMSSPFSLEAVEMLTDIGVKRWKVASGEIYNPELLDAIWATKLPVLYSSGMSTLNELDDVIAQTSSLGISYGVFQCSSMYPAPPEFWGLEVINKLKQKYHCPVGLSDHSGRPYAAYAATALGANMIELHVVFSRYTFGPDVQSSVTIEELKEIVEGVRMISGSLSAGFNKNQITSRTSNLRSNFGRSWALLKSLPKGTVLTRDHLTLKKPGTGISFDNLGKIIGSVLNQNVESNRLLTWNHLDLK